MATDAGSERRDTSSRIVSCAGIREGVSSNGAMAHRIVETAGGGAWRNRPGSRQPLIVQVTSRALRGVPLISFGMGCSAGRGAAPRCCRVWSGGMTLEARSTRSGPIIDVTSFRLPSRYCCCSY